MTMPDSDKQLPPAGWYDRGDGRRQWWDGDDWTGIYEDAPKASSSQGPLTHSALEVERKVSYVRQQTPHSLMKHLLLGWIVGYIPTIYYAMSPNHYFRL